MAFSARGKQRCSLDVVSAVHLESSRCLPDVSYADTRLLYPSLAELSQRRGEEMPMSLYPLLHELPGEGSSVRGCLRPLRAMLGSGKALGE